MDGNLHVRIISGVHVSVQEEIFEVTDYTFIARGQDNANGKKFGGGQVSSFGTDIAVICHTVATSSPTDTEWVFFPSDRHRPHGGMLV